MHYLSPLTSLCLDFFNWITKMYGIHYYMFVVSITWDRKAAYVHHGIIMSR